MFDLFCHPAYQRPSLLDQCGLRFILLVSLLFLSPAIMAELTLDETPAEIRVSLGGKPVLTYVKKERPVPKGISEDYRRSGYIHPVYSPGGKEVTGDFPADHAHQHALFFAWTNTMFDDKKVDFWNLAKKTGTVEFRGVESILRKDDRVGFTVNHAFVAIAEGRRTDVLKETWTVIVHKTAGHYFSFDIVSVQECASEKPLVLSKYRYGGMAFRGHIDWLSKDSGFKFVTSEGNNRLEGNHTRPNWVAMSGLIGGEQTSIAVMCSPKNFRAPQSVRMHPSKPYFCFAPMVTDSFRIEPGAQYVSRYRYLVHSAAVDPKVVEKHWRQYRSASDL